MSTLSQDVPAVAANADAATVLGEAPAAGSVAVVHYVPVAAVTGAATESRTLTLVNRGQAGVGSTVMATLALVASVNLVAGDAKPITLSAVANAIDVAVGDVLEWRSTHVGTTGLADPGGLVTVTLGTDPDDPNAEYQAGGAKGR